MKPHQDRVVLLLDVSCTALLVLGLSKQLHLRLKCALLMTTIVHDDSGKVFQAAARLVRLKNERERAVQRLRRIDKEIAATKVQLRSALSDDENETAATSITVGNIQTVDAPDGGIEFHGVVPVGQSFTKSPLRNRIIAYLDESGDRKVSTDEIAEEVGMTVDKQKLFWTLSHLKRDGYIERVGRGVWKFRKESVRQDDETEF